MSYLSRSNWQQHAFLQTICVPQCIFSREHAFPICARQFHSCNFLSTYESYSISRNLQVRRRHNRPVLDEGPWASVKLHSEASLRTSFNMLHSEQVSFHSLLKGHFPLDFDLRERHFSSRISKNVPGLFCFCLGIFSSLATSLCCLCCLFMLFYHTIFPFWRHSINKQSFTTVSLWWSNSFWS